MLLSPSVKRKKKKKVSLKAVHDHVCKKNSFQTFQESTKTSELATNWL